jgi:guanine nucleotide-binding protein G(i) subunit alpha
VKGLHDNTPYTEEEIQQYLSSIYANILHATKVLSQACLDKDPEDPFDDPDNLARAKSIILLADNDSALLLNAVEKYTEKVHATVGELWKDSKLLGAFNNNRYEFHVFDGAQYFLDQFDKLKPPNYIPSAEDILRCRRKTTGIISLKFVHNGVNFSIYDVGGQRNERRKWTNCKKKLFLTLRFQWCKCCTLCSLFK